MQVDYDYIIVGLGIAGISFCQKLEANKKSFIVFNDNSQKSSTVAGGLYNPVVLKRFTSVWKSEEQLPLALKMYQDLEQLLKVTLDYKIPVYRKFSSVEEQNDWFTASDKPILKNYLSNTLIKNRNPLVKAPFGYGEVLHSGRIDVKLLIKAYKTFLDYNKLLFEASFEYDLLNVQEDGVSYKNIKAKHIVFAEGFGMVKNPFFNYLPLVPTKGELLTIYAPDLKIDFVLKGPVFLIPLENDLYIVGATYEWKDVSHTITEKAKTSLLEKLETIISCSFNVINHVAGIRPTVKDRRPLIGKHPNYEHMYVLNGLGTRGVMIGPYVAKQLYECIEEGRSLDNEIDISRYDTLLLS